MRTAMKLSITLQLEEKVVDEVALKRSATQYVKSLIEYDHQEITLDDLISNKLTEEDIGATIYDKSDLFDSAEEGGKEATAHFDEASKEEAALTAYDEAMDNFMVMLANKEISEEEFNKLVNSWMKAHETEITTGGYLVA